MTIAFIHSFQSFLPEIKAYSDFFSKYGIETKEYHTDEYAEIKSDVAWHFMGLDRGRRKKIITIHEYASASVPPARRLKDNIKRWVNAKPDYRIFNNDHVQRQFAFVDGIPSGIREHGISLTQSAMTGKKEFDFIYVGSVSHSRKLDDMFHRFSIADLRDKTLLVLSKSYESLARKLSAYQNIYFKGPVNIEDVYNFIRQSRYGINYIPDNPPFNRQTSGKFLDYIACGVPIVSTDYYWVRQFQKNRGGSYFYLDKHLEHFNWEEISTFKYENPNIEGLDWDSRIKESGILEFLQSKFPDLNF